MKKAVLGTILLTISTGFALAVAEITLHLFAKPSLYVQGAAFSNSERKNLTVKGTPEGGAFSGLYEATPKGRRLRANVSGVIKNHRLSKRDIEIQTNTLGFRGGEIDWTKHPRILFLGDSVTFGDYLDESQTFVARVQTLATKDGKDWESLNAGIGAVGIDNEWALLKEKGEAVKPDIVVLNFYLNDVQPSRAVMMLPLPRLLSASWTTQYVFQGLSFLKYAAVRKDYLSDISEKEWESWKKEVMEKFPSSEGDYRTSRPAFHAKILYSFRDWGSIWSEGAMGHVLAAIDAMKAKTESLGAKFVVVIHPVSYQVEASFLINEPQVRLLKELEKRKIPALDLLPALRKAYPENKFLFYDHCHHTPLGAETVGKEIYRFLKYLS